ncbi:MAG: SUMF1/EgtB/PvdO family nonheme iron enzyme [Planctomycetia bacterium]|nr:SUMF1/EgtB/PvdO family nonheme iron enzyme [Planctomycetia bacterium]
MTRDANLLFALLALQMELVTRDQLVACVPEAIGRPGADLGRMLVERGVLREAERGAVQAVLEARVRRHGGDAAASLAAAADDPARRTLDGTVVGELVARTLAAAGRAPDRPTPLPDPAGSERYRMGQELGRGGIGRVVLAEDSRLGREVAVKIVVDNLSPALVERFVREAMVTARLEHPQIVPVHDFGTIEREGGKRPYLAMKRVKGRDLRAVVDDLAAGQAEAAAAWPRTRLLEAFQKACLGVAFAHSRGVLHRDLKPSNIMVGDFGEVYVVDWGLARVRGESDVAAGLRADGPDPGLTVDGALIGTPAYMAPEQAAGRNDEVDERADVYALGAILYEILTLRPPVEGRTVEEVLTRAREGQITPPNALALHTSRSFHAADPVPPDLEATCLRALSLRREDRHPSVLDLHADIRRFLDGAAEHERLVARAARRARAGQDLQARWRELAGEVRNAQARLEKQVAETRPWEPVERKRLVWGAEDAHRKLREERVRTWSQATAAFEEALRDDPGCGAAADGLCEMALERLAEAEADRDFEEVVLQRQTLERHDATGVFRARLEEPGRLTIRTFARPCACIRPAPGSWTAVPGHKGEIPWRKGCPAFGVAPLPGDRPSPAMRLEPEGAQFGHRDGCPTTEVPGAEVWAARYEEEDRRLVLRESKRIGVTPLSGVPIGAGSWRLEIRHPVYATVFVPVLVTRCGEWEQHVALYRPEEIPEGFVQVAGGPFTTGGRRGGAMQPETPSFARDYFLMRYPVTIGEYLEYLNDLVGQGRLEEARARRPRERDLSLVSESGGTFGLQSPDAPDPYHVRADLPVGGVAWTDAVAYAAWRTRKTGRLVRLPTDFELEKAARGVDGRIYPWGDAFDGTFSNTIAAHRERPRLMPVGSFPADCSPYGAMDLAGNILSWSWSAAEGAQREEFCLRGGWWTGSWYSAQVPRTWAAHPSATLRQHGFRLALPAMSELPPA